jgi:RNA polymerase sigma-70 factor (ECF subfamily)
MFRVHGCPPMAQLTRATHGFRGVRTIIDKMGTVVLGKRFFQSASDRPVARAAQDVSDLRALYDTHFPFVWRNLRRLGVPPEQLEDAAQEVFLVVHRKIDTYDAQWSSVQTWLFGIVLRVAQNERRSRRRRTARIVPTSEPMAFDAVPSGEADPAELVQKRQAVRMVEAALEMLGQNERAIFVLVDVENMTVPAAAEALGLNVNTAYARLRSARADFQRAVAKLRANDAPKGGKP